jgi:gliding motility-associated-like protein
MLRPSFYIVAVLILLFTGTTMAQCPVNMGFDTGDFTNWEGFTGTIDRTSYVIDVPTPGIVNGRHTIISRASKQKDPYGKFDIASPNGSAYCVQLGNSGTGAQAERLSYTFDVPANVTDYSLIYYYAVVLQKQIPPHTELQQPRFTANVFDVTKNKYADCGAFKFVASDGSPGFQTAPVGSNVVYKDWSPVTINLLSYAGHRIRLEFTTNDCSPGGHFGYAYIDVNQNCFSPVSGNVVCGTNQSITLKAPSGFAGYNWFNGTDFTKVVATGSSYTISPAPSVGTTYSVAIQPYPGIGCPDTITTTIKSPENLALNVLPALGACRSSSVNLTAPAVTAGTDPSFTLTYHTDAAGTLFIADPTAVTDSGTYYIKATSPAGCEYIKPIKLSFLPSPNLVINNPLAVCNPATVDITLPAITAGSQNTPNITYWIDANTTIPLPLADAKKIAKTSTYYIKSTNSSGCSDIKPVTVLINDLPVLVTNSFEACNSADITTPQATAGSTGNATYGYWKDAAATDTLANAKTILVSGRYYIKATTAAGCTAIAPIDITIYPYPQITITNPPAVIFPATVDITHTFNRVPGTVYYFYIDSLATKLIPDPTKIAVRGTYYIKAVNGNNCALIMPVIVTVKPPDVIDYGVNTFSPNGDGNNDTFHFKITKALQVNHFRIYNSWGTLLFETNNVLTGWDGTYNGKKMPVGTYYWIMDGYDTYLKKDIKQSGSITLVM